MDLRSQLDLLNEVAQSAALVTQATGLPPERLLAPPRPEPLPPAAGQRPGFDEPLPPEVAAAVGICGGTVQRASHAPL